jgi:predicted anti-sigma-YlaC factor YlaD
MRRPPRSRRHLDTRALLDYLEDRLAAAERDRVEDHLAGPCPACRDRLRDVGRRLEIMRADREREAPEALRARALAAFDVLAPSRQPRETAWRTAALVFDSVLDPLPAGLRRTVGEARWLRFSLGDHLLDMEVEPEAGGVVTLRGRLSVEAPALFRIEVGAARERRTAWPAASGHFALERLPAAEVTIEVSGPGGRYRLPPLAL